MAEGLRSFVTLTENPSSVFSTHMVAPHRTPVIRDLAPSALHRHSTQVVYKHTCRLNTRMEKVKYRWYFLTDSAISISVVRTTALKPWNL